MCESVAMISVLVILLLRCVSGVEEDFHCKVPTNTYNSKIYTVPVFDPGNDYLEITLDLKHTDNTGTSDEKITISILVCNEVNIFYSKNISLGSSGIHTIQLSMNQTWILNGSETAKKSLHIIYSLEFDTYINVDTNLSFNNISIPLTASISETPRTIYGDYSYYVTTVCDVLGLCQIAVSSAGLYDTDILIHLNMTSGGCSLHFNNSVYTTDDVFIVTLSRYTAVQLQTFCDMSGTVIQSTQELTVISGGLNTIMGEGKRQTFMGVNAPLTKLGKEYVVIGSNFSLFWDFIKIMTTETETTIRILGKDVKFEEARGSMRKKLSRGQQLHIKTDKKIVVTQFSWDNNAEPIYSIVPPLRKSVSPPCLQSAIYIYKVVDDLMPTSQEIVLTRIPGTDTVMFTTTDNNIELPCASIRSQLLNKEIVIYDLDSTRYVEFEDTTEASGYSFPSEFDIPSENIPDENLYGNRLDNGGREFLVAVHPFDRDNTVEPQISLVAMADDGSILSRINIEVKVIKNGMVETTMEMEVNADKSYAAVKTLTIKEPYNQVLLVTSPIDISLRTKVYSETYKAVSSVMLNYPVNVLGNEYIVGLFCHDNSLSTCSVVAIHNNTMVEVMLPDLEQPITVSVVGNENVVYTNNMKIRKILLRYTSLVFTSTDDLTGTMIKTDKAVAIFCGYHSLIDNSNEPFSTIEQFPPVNTFGFDFNIRTDFISSDNIVTESLVTSSVKVIAVQQWTTVTIISTNNTSLTEFLNYPGNFTEEQLTENVQIASSKEVLVILEFASRRDKSLIVVTPKQKTKNKYFISPFNSYESNLPTDNEVFVSGNESTKCYFTNMITDVMITESMPYIQDSYSVSLDEQEAGYIMHNKGLSGSAAGLYLEPNKICLYGLEPDRDCDGLEKEELCALYSYNDGQRRTRRIITSNGTEIDWLNPSDMYSIQPLDDLEHDARFTDFFKFHVKTCHSAYVYLSSTNGFDLYDVYGINTWFMYEIIFGNENGTTITWRKLSSGGPGKQRSSIISKMNCNEFTSFWIEWNDIGEMRIGEGDHVGEKPLIEWQTHLDSEMPFRIYNVGIKSGIDLEIEWIIHLTDELDQIKIEAPLVMEKFLNTTNDILNRSVPLEMYGFNMDKEKSMSFSVRACRDVRLYLYPRSADIHAQTAGKMLYEIQMIDFKVKVSKWTNENKHFLMMENILNVSNCFISNSYGYFWISWMENILTFGTGRNVGAMPILETQIDTSTIQDIYIASLTNDSRLWIITRKEIPTYIGDDNTYVMDFDLDGDYDEDCAMRIYDCGVPVFDNAHAHIPYSGHTDNKYGNVHTVICDEDYTHSGSTVTRCLPTGKWSKEFRCLPNCKEPPQVLNTGSVDGYSRTYSTWSTYTYECATGSSMTGNSTIICQDNGEWSEPRFECICPLPPRKLNTDYTNPGHEAKYRYGAAYDYKCMAGYSMTGNGTITCLKNGQWTETSFTCTDNCKCPCNTPADLTEEDIQQMKDKIRRENLIDKKSVSKYKRKITSAPDNRLSAKAIGYVGVACLTTTGLVVVLIDAVTLINTLNTVFQNIKGFFF